MHGVSEVIAIILILMITISLAGLAYMFMSTTMSDVTSSAGSTVDTTTSSMLTSFTIESLDVAKAYVRNTGQNVLTGLSVYVNDEPATYNVTPTSIAAGAVGTITIYSFIPDGATMKVTSTNGFSASKVAHPCEKSVLCMKLDESNGLVAYDSSPYGIDGTLVNGPSWTSGRFGGGLLFDGADDYVVINTSEMLQLTSAGTIMFWFKSRGTQSNYPNFISKLSGSGSSSVSYDIGRPNSEGVRLRISDGVTSITATKSFNYNDLNWHLIVANWNGTSMTVGIDGEFTAPVAQSVNAQANSTHSFRIGNRIDGGYINGTIDEIRIYNRAIY